MQPQIEYGEWWAIDSNEGMDWYPASLFGKDEVCSFYDKVFSIEKVRGYGARLSAPGYLDCTDWTVFSTQKDAEEFLKETYLDE